MTSFEQKMTELRGFENWSQMAIYDPPNFGTLPRGPQGPQDPKSPAKLVTIGSSFKKCNKKFQGAEQPGWFLTAPSLKNAIIWGAKV